MSFLATLLVALPLVSCSNSDSIGRFPDAAAGSGGSSNGSGGAGLGGSGLGGSLAGAGGSGLAGAPGSGGGGNPPGTGGEGSGGVKAGTGGAGPGGAGGIQPGTGGAKPGTGGAGSGGAGGAKPGTGGAGSGGRTGSGGATGTDGGSADVLVSTDASALAALCLAHGGQISSELCCSNTTDFPNTCLVGACGCSPSSSHMVAVCVCSNGCFSPAMGGCIAAGGSLDAGSDGKVTCGSATCGEGEYCCNPPSNQCTPIGSGCIVGGGENGGSGGTLDAAPDANLACGSATCGAGEYCCNPLLGTCAPIGDACGA